MKTIVSAPLLMIAILSCVGVIEAKDHLFSAGTYASKNDLLQNIRAESGDTIDCRNAVFHQDNLNREGSNYPCTIRNNPGNVTVRWARVVGHVPKDIAWQTYYSQGNGCAISAFYGGSATFRDCFVGGPGKGDCVWDFFRFARQEGEIRNYIKDCAFINARDDGETDTGLKNLTIENSLIYAYTGISSRPGNRKRGAATHRDITIRDTVMRMFPCIGNTEKTGAELTHNAPFKWRVGSQKYVIHNFVVGAGWPGASRSQVFRSGSWRGNWEGALSYIKEATGENVFCYLGDDGFNNAIPLGPFKLLEGEEARKYLTKKVHKWIEAHRYWEEIWPDYDAILIKNILEDISQQL
ncbi:MAG: hypothetical protein ACYTGQ_11485 [Planctomycetota bacterium]|jgi:hypothetical protein